MTTIIISTNPFSATIFVAEPVKIYKKLFLFIIAAAHCKHTDNSADTASVPSASDAVHIDEDVPVPPVGSVKSCPSHSL